MPRQSFGAVAANRAILVDAVSDAARRGRSELRRGDETLPLSLRAEERTGGDSGGAAFSRILQFREKSSFGRREQTRSGTVKLSPAGRVKAS